jgi:hypothetical protein
VLKENGVADGRLRSSRTSTSGQRPTACRCAPRRSTWCAPSGWSRCRAPEQRRGTVEHGGTRPPRELARWPGSSLVRTEGAG